MQTLIKLKAKVVGGEGEGEKARAKGEEGKERSKTKGGGMARCWDLKKKSSSPSSSGEMEAGHVEAESGGALWQRSILLGERCEPPTFSGLILYDRHGYLLPPHHVHPPPHHTHPHPHPQHHHPHHRENDDELSCRSHHSSLQTIKHVSLAQLFAYEREMERISHTHAYQIF